MRPETAVDGRTLVRRTQWALVVICTASALLWALAAGSVMSVVTTRAVGVAAAFIIGAIVMWLDRVVWSRERVALWIEEHHPELAFALVTAVDRAAVAERDRSMVDGLLLRGMADAGIDAGSLWRRAALRRMGPALLGVGLAALAMMATARLPVRTAVRRASTASPIQRIVDRLAQIHVTVIPPTYSHLPRQEIAQPGEIKALVGSELIFRGRGSARGLNADVGSAAAQVLESDTGWEVHATMPDSPTLVRLAEHDATAAVVHDRLVTLIPIADMPPSVELRAPVHDSVMRRGAGTLALRALASDDIGLQNGHFEIVITVGDEDEGGVHARTLVLGGRLLGDARTAQLEASLPLDSLSISPGSVVSIRALASDNNTVSGPGIGASDTRTFRIARPDEYDSVAVESAAPSVADSSALSERLVILGTTRLITRMTHHPSLPIDSLAGTSRELANQQDAVRNTITAVMSADDENELPIADVLTAPERALLDSGSYAMGEASAQLATRAPQMALPFERRALLMVDSARSLARRLYLRSRPPRLLVDVGHVRLSGTDHPDPGARSAGPRDTIAAGWLARLTEVVRGLALGSTGEPRATVAQRAAVDSLVVLRVEALVAQPPLADALTGAIDAIRSGRDPLPALDRARGLLTDPVSDVRELQSGGAGP